MEKKNISSENGHIAIAIHWPEQSSTKLAVLCPGFLDSKDYTHLVALAEELCDLGYVAVRLDPTGTWESSGTISNYTVTQYLQDIRTVIDYFSTEAIYEKILVGGHSRGGQMSILYAARDPRINLVLGIMPSSRPITGPRREEWKKNGASVSYRDLPTSRDQKKEFKVPFGHVLDKDQYDTLGDAKKIKAPVILIAGEEDLLITPQEVQELFEAAHEPKKIMVVGGVGHDYRLQESEIKEVNTIILENIKEYL